VPLSNAEALADGAADPPTYLRCSRDEGKNNVVLEKHLALYLTRLGRNATMFVIGDSTMRGLSEVLQRIASSLHGVQFTLSVHYIQEMACISTSPDSIFREFDYFGSPITSEPDVVVMNVGIHQLHVHPARPCREVNGAVKDCGNYMSEVTGSIHSLARRFPNADLIWKTTNSVCEGKMPAYLQTVINQYHSEENAANLIRQCQLECAWKYGNTSDNQCQDEVLDRRGTYIQRNQSYDAIQRSPHPVKVVDAFSITDKHCDQTEDGHHYKSLDSCVAIGLSYKLLNKFPL
jgi:hypothetical protein